MGGPHPRLLWQAVHGREELPDGSADRTKQHTTPTCLWPSSISMPPHRVLGEVNRIPPKPPSEFHLAADHRRHPSPPSLPAQATLFHSIKPLFSNKPLLIVCNKTDVRPMDDLGPEDRAAVDEMAREAMRIGAGGAGEMRKGGRVHVSVTGAGVGAGTWQGTGLRGHFTSI